MKTRIAFEIIRALIACNSPQIIAKWIYIHLREFNDQDTLILDVPIARLCFPLAMSHLREAIADNPRHIGIDGTTIIDKRTGLELAKILHDTTTAKYI